MQNSNALETPGETESAEKITVVGIRFRSCGKIYTFMIDDLEVETGIRVVVDSEMGLSVGQVAIPKYTIEKSDAKLKKVIRKATEEDFETVRNNRALEEEAKSFCMQKAKEYNLEMKLVTTETTLDKKRLIFYFTADGRIDFRELVRDLAAKFKTRIEMRQIGVRDEVRLLGGIGACGRQACCSLFLTSFEPITIKMAKQQELSINQNKLSGICGRLMCCLGYEYRETDKASDRRQKDNDREGLKKEEAEGKNSTEASTEQISPSEDITESGEASDKKTDTSGGPAEQTKGAEEGKTSKRKRRRRRRPAKGKRTGEPQETKKSGQAPAPESAEKKKGKPYSKRRKFWKKKKQ